MGGAGGVTTTTGATGTSGGAGGNGGRRCRSGALPHAGRHRRCRRQWRQRRAVLRFRRRWRDRRGRRRRAGRRSLSRNPACGRGQRDRGRRWRGRADSRLPRRRRDRGCRRTEQFDRPESGRCWRHEVRFSAPDDAFLSTAHGEKLATSPCTSTAAWNSKPISVPSRRSWTSRPPTLGQAPRSERRHGSRALSRMGPLRRRPRPPRPRARLSQRLHPARAGHLMTNGPMSGDQSHCVPINC